MAGEANEKNGGNKKLLIIAVIVIVILLCAVGAMAALLIGSKKEEAKKPVVEKPKEVVTAENAVDIVQEMEEERQRLLAAPQHYTVTQNSDWVFPDGNSPSTNAYVKNDASNETPVYFDLIVDETGDVVYSSPILELGAEISGFKLDRALDAGEYVCTIIYHLVDDEQNELTTVNIGTKIIVEN